MLLKALVLLCVVAAAAAAVCGPLQKIRVKEQWAQAYGEGRDRQSFGLAVWRAVFKLDPSARNLFNRVNGDDPSSPEFSAHSLRVLSGLDMTISFIDDTPAFEAQLAHLRGQHIDRKIPSYYFATFGKALGQVVAARLGKCYDEDIFKSCYNLVVEGIKA
jgi:hypothetical protein